MTVASSQEKIFVSNHNMQTWKIIKMYGFVVNKFLPFVGRKTIFWLGLSFFCSMFLGFIELLISFFIQLFLVNLGVLKTTISFFGLNFNNIGLLNILIFLVVIGIFRFIAQFLSIHSNSFSFHYSLSRFKNLAIYDLIYKTSGDVEGVSDVNYNLSEIFPKASEFISNFVSFCSAFMQCSILILIMLYTNLKEAALGLIGIIIISLIVYKFNICVRNIAHKVPLEQKKLNAGIEKISKNLLFIKIMKTNNAEHKNLIQSIINYSLKSIQASFLGTLAGTLPSFLGILMLVIISFVSQIYWHNSSLALISFIYLLVRFIQNLTALSQIFGFLNSGFPQLKAALNYFYKFEEQERSFAISPSNAITFAGSKLTYTLPINHFFKEKTNNIIHEDTHGLPALKFTDVSFLYPKSTTSILHHFNFDVKPGEQVGIIGPSGSGKSTILMLILGIYKPTSGDFLISGLKPYTYFSLPSSRIGYVGPEPFLIRGSFKENLLYGIKKDVSEKEIWGKLKEASLFEFVNSVGLNYHINEDQTGLSAGQKQRLCIARAFLNEPQLLVLDEATANLDEATEKDIATSLEKLKRKCTVVIVSHRPGILISADKIIDLR